MTRVRRANCLRHCKAGSSSKFLQEDNEHQEIVSGSSKQISTYCHIENNISTNQICWRIPQCVMTLRPSPLYGLFSLFHRSTFNDAVSLARLVKAEIVCPL